MRRVLEQPLLSALREKGIQVRVVLEGGGEDVLRRVPVRGLKVYYDIPPLGFQAGTVGHSLRDVDYVVLRELKLLRLSGCRVIVVADHCSGDLVDQRVGRAGIEIVRVEPRFLTCHAYYPRDIYVGREEQRNRERSPAD